MRRELLIGCGNNRDKRLHRGHPEWPERPEGGPITLDIDPRCKPDNVFDLTEIGERASLPFASNRFDEIHAYEVLEHCGRQGDHRLFFRQFHDFWRVLKPGGLFFATVPHYTSLWAWGDPSHTRVINRGTLVFLDQRNYQAVGKTAMSDYRHDWRGDFRLVEDGVDGPEETKTYWFCLEAVKEGL